ncbi:MAG: hypothetical protein HWQ35_28305 [Nostoc sp. NMS1]|uniref:hypothetical protein n=1 Tax=unclassified Nostoc TaxID=2593658 RepID=UPI0025E12738|nr:MULTISPECIES: hypothetical protein [unclassified Nostoc]MBN3910304.1 hypothetical protein [Nostoc sp. NMS1]MBN3993483.1 hypothetical protein [Nostoc sp. NMS2]
MQRELRVALCAQEIKPSIQSTVGHLLPIEQTYQLHILKLQHHAATLINRCPKE